MKWITEQKGFQFHTKCRGLKLNHLCFADDVLFFCKGEYQSVEMILRGLETFSRASGLHTSAAKSNIYSANMEEQCIQDICEPTGYQRGALPFGYLGVPRSARKLSATDCEMLVEKMATKVRTWGSRNISYAGRVMLVNSVLMHMHSYWASIFILPKKVLKSIIGICRSFLWDGKGNSTKLALVAWDTMCKPKQQGRLGIKDCME
ncbi:uncharacterized protein [Nicotiana sylvestris]|uniref:uncharacterized protein n=1 Tax=Nicotiana sylvestris TaxID=4096 RepID=UPI00388C679C